MDGEQGRGFGEPGDAQEEAAVSFAAPPAQGSSVIADVVERNTERLSRIEGVHGIAVGRTAIGDDSVRIDVEDDSVRERLPDEIEGYPVEVVVVPGGFGTLPAGSPYTG